MSEPNGNHPDSGRADPVPGGDAYLVYTPCHGHPVFLPIDEAVPGARLGVVCPHSGEAWLVELVADGQAESGLRPVWTDPATGETNA